MTTEQEAGPTTDVLGEPYLAEIIELPPDDEGDVVATLVKRAAPGTTTIPGRTPGWYSRTTRTLSGVRVVSWAARVATAASGSSKSGMSFIVSA